VSFSQAATGFATFGLNFLVTFFEFQLLIMDFLLIAIVISPNSSRILFVSIG